MGCGSTKPEVAAKTSTPPNPEIAARQPEIQTEAPPLPDIQRQKSEEEGSANGAQESERAVSMAPKSQTGSVGGFSEPLEMRKPSDEGSDELQGEQENDNDEITDIYSDLPGAALIGNIPRIRHQLECYKAEGRDINELHEDGYTAMHRAAQGGVSEAIVILRAGGCEAVTPSNGVVLEDGEIVRLGGETPLHLAVFHRNYDAVITLLSGDAIETINAKEETYGFTALHIAALRGRPEIADALLQAGASPHIQANGGYTAKTFATELQRREADGMTSPKGRYNATHQAFTYLTPPLISVGG